MYSVELLENRKLDKCGQGLKSLEISLWIDVESPFSENHSMSGDIPKSTFISGKKTAKIALQQIWTSTFDHF